MSLQVPFPSRTAYVSGASTVTVFSGQGVLLGVIVNPLSGGAVSFSGSSILVQDAQSGQATIASGSVPFYYMPFGAQSGLSNGVNAALTQGMLASMNLPYMEGYCGSGLVVVGAANFGVTVIYNK